MKFDSWLRTTFVAALVLTAGTFTPVSQAHDVAQVPLMVSGSGVPGNLALVPSVEFPTIDSQANIGDFNANRWYSGYFDNKKCYEYVFSVNEADRHFNPVAFTADGVCPGANRWSGNWLNWAATQTIDPFRLALTGGDRVKDTTTETWVQKARHHRDNGYYPARRVPASGSNQSTVSNYTGASWSYIHNHIQGLNFAMRFTMSGGRNGGNNIVIPYDPSRHDLDEGAWLRDAWTGTAWVQCSKDNKGNYGCADRGQNVTVPRYALSKKSHEVTYEVSVRVKVCVPGLLESDGRCKQYGSNYKPEGLIQEYSDRILYSIFGYMAEDGNQRHGGIMRARQKFVGPDSYFPGQGAVPNVATEWDRNTGVLIRNPDSADAAATGANIQDSGVINYLNKFGRMTDRYPKSNDPVSELYYAAFRYFRGQGNYPVFSNFPAADNTPAKKYVTADGFPVITSWDDPIRYACQVNAILGIGDVNTHQDHDIPSPDLDLARSATQKVFNMESISKSPSAEFSGRGNSAYIAGLAYYANTNDLRPDDQSQPNTLGKQTVATYWVDVREAQLLEPKNRNQYWLAAKYGGLKVPEDFDYDNFAGPVPKEWWHNTPDYLTSGSYGEVTSTVTQYPRADNFFLASEADKMVASLRQAFQRIASAAAQASGGIAASGARATADLLAYVPSYDTTDWTGNLRAHLLNKDGSLKEPASWDAKSKLGALADAAVRGQSGRKMYYIAADGSSADFTVSGLGGNDAAAQKLGFGDAEAVANEFPGQTIADVVNYLRGDHAKERRNGGFFRDRSGRLGDIFGSQPAVLDKASYGYLNLPANWGGGHGTGKYAAFVASKEDRKPMVLVGSNDGFLHAFDASADGDGGKELWAIAPSSVLQNMGRLASSDYVHRYYVDGSPTQGDAYLNGAWKTVVLVPTGAGGRSIFALDVTAGASPIATPSVLWEFTDEDLGLTVGHPKIAVLNDGTWVAVFGNGYASDNHQAFLYVVKLADGELLAKIAAGDSGSEDAPNALSSPAIIDVDYDGITDLVYAGDYHGNLWRFDLSTLADDGTRTVPDLDSVSPVRLFTATSGTPAVAQPITGGVTASIHPSRGRLVFFGTGQYMMIGDNDAPTASDQIQSFYAIWDDPEADTYPVPRSSLQSQQFVANTITGTRSVTENVVNWASHRGWYIDLKVVDESGDLVGAPQGERFIGQPTVALGRVLFTTFVTAGGDICDPKGANWINALWATSGAGAMGPIGGETVGSQQLDGGSSPITSAVTIVTDRSGGDEGCQPGDEGCDEPTPPGDDDDEDPGELGAASPKGCIVDVSMLTALGLNPLLQISCGRQSWREWN